MSARGVARSAPPLTESLRGAARHERRRRRRARSGCPAAGGDRPLAGRAARRAGTRPSVLARGAARGPGPVHRDVRLEPVRGRLRAVRGPRPGPGGRSGDGGCRPLVRARPLRPASADPDPRPARRAAGEPDRPGRAASDRRSRCGRRLRERTRVTGAACRLGRDAWRAFTSADPTDLERLLDAGTADLPFLEAALLRHLEEFPSTRDGLSRTERQLLDAVALGVSSESELFERTTASDERPYLGDAPFLLYVGRLPAAASRSSPSEMRRSS